MEIESLHLDTVEDYLYTVATITNSQASNKNNLFSFLGTQGVDLSEKENEVDYIVRNHYGYGGHNITEHLHFVNTKEQVNNLCAQDLYKTKEQD